MQNRLFDDDICITFDDALRCQYDIAKPVLDRLGITAFWFIYSSAFADGEPPRLELYRYFRTVMFDRMDAFSLAFDQAIAASEYVDIVAEGLRGYDAATYLSEYPFFTEGDRRFRFIRDNIFNSPAYDMVMDKMISATNFNMAGAREIYGWMMIACAILMPAGMS